MRDRIKVLLRTLCADERTEAKWLNTLSLLEFTGARKISKTVATRHPGLDVLEHLADETRHALAFKQLAHNVVGGDPGAYFLESAAKRYFYRLDTELSAWVADLVGSEHVLLNYLVVTTMIERRAMELYPLYRSATERDDVRDELQVIIREEQNHRVAIEERCLALLSESGVRDLSAPSTVESAFWGDFVTAAEDALGLDVRLAG
jgi:hypothetical protein